MNRRVVAFWLAVLLGVGLTRGTDGASSNAAPIAALHSAVAPVKPRHYPLHLNIETTVFWIGDSQAAPMLTLNSNGQSLPWPSWILRDPPGKSLLNPYYIALPFNDLAYPTLARRWLPAGWNSGSKKSAPTSACQHRWIEMKNAEGRSCFAQWEDVGPLRTNDAAYVFGTDRPLARRGLDVSPAVAKYLGINSSALISWRFVDDADVPPGMWLRYDEQKILLQAMRDREKML